MTTATPSSVTLQEKKRLWNQSKYDTFEEISKDKSTLFNYFLVNNDIFHMIAPQDEYSFKKKQLQAEEEKSTVFFGSVGAVLFLDQVVFRFAFPNFGIKKFRFSVNLAKYLLTPCIVYMIYKDNFMDEYIYFFYKMQEKYSFDFKDYMKANQIFERALAVNRLEELYEKRAIFNWEGVPELPKHQQIV